VITLGAERGRFLFFQWLAATFELSLKSAADGANGGGGAAAGERDCGKEAAARNACRIDCPQHNTFRKHPL